MEGVGAGLRSYWLSFVAVRIGGRMADRWCEGTGEEEENKGRNWDMKGRIRAQFSNDHSLAYFGF